MKRDLPNTQKADYLRKRRSYNATTNKSEPWDDSAASQRGCRTADALPLGDVTEGEDEDCFRLHFNSNDLYSKLDILEALNIPVDSSFLAHVPKDEIKLSKDEHDKVEKLLDFLEELEDIQNVFSNQTLGLN